MRRRVPDERTAIFTIRLTPTERAAVLLGEAVFSGGAA
jgi:hypothetical protein